MLAAAGCPARQVLFVGNNLACDVTAPMAHGMRTALVRPHGPRPGEELRLLYLTGMPTLGIFLLE